MTHMFHVNVNLILIACVYAKAMKYQFNIMIVVAFDANQVIVMTLMTSRVDISV